MGEVWSFRFRGLTLPSFFLPLLPTLLACEVRSHLVATTLMIFLRISCSLNSIMANRISRWLCKNAICWSRFEKKLSGKVRGAWGLSPQALLWNYAYGYKIMYSRGKQIIHNCIIEAAQYNNSTRTTHENHGMLAIIQTGFLKATIECEVLNAVVINVHETWD